MGTKDGEKTRGRDKLFTPEELRDLFHQYEKHVKSTPVLVHDFVGKNGTDVLRQKERPLIYEGFELFVIDNTKAKGIDQYFTNQGGAYAEFLEVCSYIRKKCRVDQITGGMAGIYNPSITQRLNNLTESTKQEHDGKIEVVFVDNKTIL